MWGGEQGNNKVREKLTAAKPAREVPGRDNLTVEYHIMTVGATEINPAWSDRKPEIISELKIQNQCV